MKQLSHNPERNDALFRALRYVESQQRAAGSASKREFYAASARELKETLASLNLPMARSVARRFGPRAGLDADAAFSDAIWTLEIAISRFQPDRGGKFSTYYYHCYRRRIFRRQRRRPVAFSALESNGIPLQGCCYEVDFDRSLHIEHMRAAMAAVLTDMEREMLERRYLRGEPLRAIGARYGKGKATAHQVCNRALAKLARAMNVKN